MCRTPSGRSLHEPSGRYVTEMTFVQIAYDARLLFREIWQAGTGVLGTLSRIQSGIQGREAASAETVFPFCYFNRTQGGGGLEVRS